MADWPDIDALKAALGVTTDARDDALQLALDAATEQVVVDVGGEVEDPSASLAQAALLLAVTVMKAPDAPFGVAAVFDAGGLYVARSNPNYVRLLKGQRVSFGLA